MTNKEFFIKTLQDEQPKFIKVIKAIPTDKLDWKPGDKARTAGRIAFQLASQPFFMSSVALTGAPDWSTYREPTNPNIDEMVALAEKNFAKLIADLATVSDADWENGVAKMVYPGGEWATKRYDMAWGFLFDAIHHRGQLTSYLRGMGAKVPIVYGNSADESPTGSSSTL